jgi:hypothetical protein
MGSTPISRPSTPSANRENTFHARSSSFRSSSPTRPISVEHPMPYHQHLHFHTIRSPTSLMNDPDSSSAGYDEEIFPPISISAQILAPLFNTPAPSSFKALTADNLTTNGRSRGAEARAGALGSLSRSSSHVRKNHRRPSNEDISLTNEYLGLIGDGRVDCTGLEELRRLARERGVPNQLRKVFFSMNQTC